MEDQDGVAAKVASLNSAKVSRNQHLELITDLVLLMSVNLVNFNFHKCLE